MTPAGLCATTASFLMLKVPFPNTPKGPSAHLDFPRIRHPLLGKDKIRGEDTDDYQRPVPVNDECQSFKCGGRQRADLHKEAPSDLIHQVSRYLGHDYGNDATNNPTGPTVVALRSCSSAKHCAAPQPGAPHRRLQTSPHNRDYHKIDEVVSTAPRRQVLLRPIRCNGQTRFLHLSVNFPRHTLRGGTNGNSGTRLRGCGTAAEPSRS